MSLHKFDLSIIIVSWNVSTFLRMCLQSIATEIDGDGSYQVETIVVDNASTDGTSTMVQRNFPWVRLVEAKENLGFARANNLGLEGAKGKHVLFLNPDTELTAGSLAGMIDFLQANGKVGAVGPALINPDQSLQNSIYPFPTLPREFWRLMHLERISYLSSYPLAKWRNGDPRQVDVIQGACLLVRSSALEEVGLFDEDYFIYTEEVDLCRRLKKAGLELYWLPSVEVIHHGGQSTRQASQMMFLQLYHSKITFFRKHYGPLSVMVYKFILLLASLVRILTTPLAVLRRDPNRRAQLRLAGNYARLVFRLPGM